MISQAAFGKQQEGASSRANLYALARATREEISSAGARACAHRPEPLRLPLVSVSHENQATYLRCFNTYLGALLQTFTAASLNVALSVAVPHLRNEANVRLIQRGGDE